MLTLVSCECEVVGWARLRRVSCSRLHIGPLSLGERLGEDWEGVGTVAFVRTEIGLGEVPAVPVRSHRG